MPSTTCAYCKRFSNFTIRWGEVLEGGHRVRFAAKCDYCTMPSLGTGWSEDIMVGSDVEDASYVRSTLKLMNEAELAWTPQIGVAPEVHDVPDHIARAAKEAYSSRSVGNNMAAVLMARTVVEATAKEKQIGGKNLAAKINGMRDADLIRPDIADLAHEIRFAGNDMAHGDIDVPIDETDSEEILALMAEVLSEVFQGPARVARVKAKRQAK